MEFCSELTKQIVDRFFNIQHTYLIIFSLMFLKNLQKGVRKMSFSHLLFLSEKTDIHFKSFKSIDVTITEYKRPA